MSVRDAKHRPIKLPIIITAIMAALLAIIIFTAIVFRDRAGQLVLQVKPGVSLRQVGIVTPDDSSVKPTRIPAKVLQAAPASLQKVIRTFWKPPGDVTNWSVYHGHDGFSVLLEPSSAAAITAALPAPSQLAARVNYGSGWYGEETIVENFSAKHQLFLRSSFQNVARNTEKLTVELLDRTGGWNADPPVIASGEMRNPLYAAPAPLLETHRLPTSETNGTVTVSLRAFVSKAVSLYGKSNNGADLFTRAAAGDFMRAEGTPLDANHGLLLLKVEEDGTTDPEWAIDKAEFFYGKPGLSFDGRAQAVTSGGLTYVICRNDPGVLQQPVKVSVSLFRKRNFPTDEIAKIELPIPAKGTLSKVARAPVWSGEITAQSGNMTTDMFHWETHANGRSNTMSVYIHAPSANMNWKESTFTGPDVPPVKMSKFSQYYQFSANTLLQNFDVYNPKRVASSSPGFDVSRYTTMSLQLLVPRSYEKKFEFTVRPVEAEER